MHLDSLVVVLLLTCVLWSLRRHWPTHGRSLLLSAIVLWLSLPLWGALLSRFLQLLLTPFDLNPNRMTLLIGPILFAVFWFMRLYQKRTSLKVERGTRLDNISHSGVFGWRGTNQSLTGVLTLAGIELSRTDESRHFKMIGTTGTGKSTAIQALMKQSLARGDRLVVADPDFSLFKLFYDPAKGDVILSAFDPRSAQWDPYQELKQAADYDALASALVVPTQRSDLVWVNYARVFLATVLKRTQSAGVGELAELLRVVQSASLPELRLLLNNSPAAPFVESGNERMFASIRSVCMSSLSPLTHLHPVAITPFAIKDWLRSDGRALFLPYQADQIASVRSLISTWMRLAIDATLSRPEQDSAIWFVIDELDALGAIDGLKDALVRLRRFGGRCVLGFQSIGQLVGTYGEQDAKTIGENCGNTLILRCSGSGPGGTARYAQELIGERQVVRSHLSQTRPKRWWGRADRSESVGQQRSIEAAVLASEIEQLPDLHGYFKRATDPTWRPVALKQARDLTG